MSDGKLVFDTSISTDGFESDLKGLQNTVNSGGYSIGKGVKSILGADIIKKAVNELFEFGTASVDAASQMESAQKRVNDVFGSNADIVFNYGKEAKNNTPAYSEHFSKQRELPSRKYFNGPRIW